MVLPIGISDQGTKNFVLTIANVSFYQSCLTIYIMSNGVLALCKP